MKAKKSYGQHFLADASVVKKIVEAAQVAPRETVLEVGPGKGVLTQALVENGAKVVAVEADRDMVGVLRERFGDRITLKQADILSLSDAEIEALVGRKTYKLVANLPYNVGMAVVARFLALPRPPSRLVVMLQKEVADRLVASPPDMSVLSVASQLFADVRRLFVVPPGAFRPPPKVQSAVVELVPRPRSSGHEEVIALAKAGFASKRKQLQRNLAEAGLGDTQEIKRMLVSLCLSARVRAQELSVEDWVRLSAQLRAKAES